MQTLSFVMCAYMMMSSVGKENRYYVCLCDDIWFWQDNKLFFVVKFLSFVSSSGAVACGWGPSFPGN